MNAPQEVPSEIRAVLIPLHDMALLLPNAAVAEVIDYRLPKPIAEAPGWLSGSINWRQRTLPVIQMENMLGQSVQKPGVRQRIAVCHGQSVNSRFPYVGVVAQGIPRLVRLYEDMITTVEGVAETADMPAHAKVTVADEISWIPDLDKIESMLTQVL